TADEDSGCHRRRGWQKGNRFAGAAVRGKASGRSFSGCMFLFRSRRGTSIRILVYDGQGFWLAQKRLSKGRFQWWPTGKQAARVLEAHQAQLLLQVTAKETVPHA